MLKVGLTGGIGSGKSTAVDAFRVLGIPIIDADQIAKEIVSKEHHVLDQIVTEFGTEILLENGELDRKKLKQLVFSDAKSLATLEAIVHPQIKSSILQQIKEIADSDKHAPYIIIDIPLLIEKDYQHIFDHIIVIDCTTEQQIKRVMQRDGMDKNSICKIIKQQASRSQRKQVASHILDNSEEVEKLIQQVNQLHQHFVSGL